ncbi:MAG TPA: hypothetical protein VGM98_00580 [Schlesneria sp.]|jgi:hypothetical protein
MSLDSKLPPITYSVDTTQGIIFETWHGDVTASDLSYYWRRYLADPQVLAIRRTVVDLRYGNLLFTGEEMESLIASIVIPTLNGLDWTTAIVVDRPDQFGVSRQYQVFAERYSKDCIFPDSESALNWLRSTVHPE